MSDEQKKDQDTQLERRSFLKCMAWAGAGVVWAAAVVVSAAGCCGVVVFSAVVSVVLAAVVSAATVDCCPDALRRARSDVCICSTDVASPATVRTPSFCLAARRRA